MIDQVRPNDLDAWLAAQGGSGVVLDVREAPELRAASVAPQGFDVTAQGGSGVVLDVREAPELRAASVAPHGFDVIAIPMNEIPARLAELDAGRPVACLCHHGARSQRVAMFLAQNGFERVANIAGGIDAWSRERDPGVPLY